MTDNTFSELNSLFQSGSVRGALVVFAHEWENDKSSMPEVNVRYYSNDEVENDLYGYINGSIYDICHDSTWNHVYVIYDNNVVFFRDDKRILKRLPTRIMRMS